MLNQLQHLATKEGDFICLWCPPEGRALRCSLYRFPLKKPFILYSQQSLKKYAVAVKGKLHLPFLVLFTDEFEIKSWSLHHL